MLISILTYKERPNRIIINNKEFAEAVITHKNDLDYSEDWDVVEINTTISEEALDQRYNQVVVIMKNKEPTHKVFINDDYMATRYLFDIVKKDKNRNNIYSCWKTEVNMGDDSYEWLTGIYD